MTYQRKTTDEYEIQGFWYGSWELETTETNRKDAIKQLKIYRKNQPEVAHKIVKKRVKIVESTPTIKVELKFRDKNQPSIFGEYTTPELAMAEGSRLLDIYAGVKALFITWEDGSKSVYNPDGSHLFTIPPIKAC